MDDKEKGLYTFSLGRHEDQCNFDGYTNSIYSVTVGAVDHTGRHSTYSEACAANLNMIVAYSSGSGKHIVCYHSPSTGFLCTPDHFVIDYYGSRERYVRSYTWRNFCCCTQCSRCFFACFGSTVSPIVQYVLYPLSESIFRAIDQI